MCERTRGIYGMKRSVLSQFGLGVLRIYSLFLFIPPSLCMANQSFDVTLAFLCRYNCDFLGHILFAIIP